jgi:hypothetical protein
MKVRVMKFSPASHYLLSIMSQISFNFSFSNSPRLCSFPKCERPSYTPVQNKQNDSSV